jgi:NADH:ubiquinone oxidoreductase subunit F (NADH-binding)
MARREVLLEGDPVTSLDEYVARGGGRGLTDALDGGAEHVFDELERSGLRGRGGAGFPVHLKWRSVASGGSGVGDRFVVVNGAEGEPGTFKDRTLIRHNPYALIEGGLIAARTLGARELYVALKASFELERLQVEVAAAEIVEAGWAGDVVVELVGGPDEYLFGEEKALLEVIEGEDPLPRVFPPYLYGLFSVSPNVGWSANEARSQQGAGGPAANPTLVNNVETFSAVARILGEGGDWYASMGTPESPGTVICTVSGDTLRHGVGEFEMGTPLEEVLVELGGGIAEERSLRYVLSGVANPVIRGADVGAPVSYEGLASIGSGLGSAGFMAFDDRTDPAELAAAVSRFLWVESCGQCPACKLGTGEITRRLDEVVDGEGSPRLLSVVDARLTNVTDAARCFLPVQEQRLVASLMGDIRDPQVRQATERRGLLITKLVDLVDGRFTLDERQARKRPDWTYEDPPPR